MYVCRVLHNYIDKYLRLLTFLVNFLFSTFAFITTIILVSIDLSLAQDKTINLPSFFIIGVVI